MLVKSVEKPNAVASYEQTVAKVKQMENLEASGKAGSFSLFATDFLVLKKELNTEYSNQRSTEYTTGIPFFIWSDGFKLSSQGTGSRIVYHTNQMVPNERSDLLT